MSSGLFRPEVLEAKRNSWLGRISLTQPVSTLVLTGFAVATALAIVLFLVFGSYSRRSTVTGQLVPDLGLSTVMAPNGGVAVRLYVTEGQWVETGTPLALIRVPKVSSEGEDVLNVMREGLSDRKRGVTALAQSQDQQLQMQISGARRQLLDSRRELAQIENEIRTRRAQVNIANQTLTRYETAAAQQYVSGVQLDHQRQSVLELTNAQQMLERQATGIRKNIAVLEQNLLELPAQRQGIAAMQQRDIASLEQERIQQETNNEILIKAPISGVVASRLLEPGQATQAGQVVMNLVPRGSKLQAELLVPSQGIGFIEPGNAVLLRYQAFPYQKFGHQQGRVIRISRNAIATNATNVRSGPPVYRVLVSLNKQNILAYGKQEPLRPGMVLDADIMGERRSLLEWIFEPLYSVSGRISDAN